jgi:hypothetical protein
VSSPDPPASHEIPINDLGHAWVATTMNYVHVAATHIEDAWIAGQQRAAEQMKG